ncbi:MAG: beta-eliminating lyase-related protein [Synergistaceae bacterium]|nr:beta-eliminating lyase-related protein [Synergistaceae bacterium]
MFCMDLRSDTVTLPSLQMREAMCKAEVGDDVYMDDPTVKILESKAAELTGKEAALYVTSGTMGNITALLSHDIHGYSVMAGKDSHIANNEGGGISTIAGAFCQQVIDDSGLPLVSDMELIFKNSSNVHHAPSKLLCIENTHNKRGGMASTVAEMKVCADWAREHKMLIHLDGARIFNASIACGEKVSDYCALVDSVQICLSKGLGAPVGSLVCGAKDYIEKARFWRKRIGGGLRQVGIIAAAGIYALDNNIERMALDHSNAAFVKKMFLDAGIETLDVARPTNMVYFKINDASKTNELLSACAQRGVKFGSTAPAAYRIVFHLNIDSESAISAANIIIEEIKRIGD